MQIIIPSVLFNAPVILIELGIIANLTIDGQYHIIHDPLGDRFLFYFNTEDKPLLTRALSRMFGESHSRIIYL